MWKILEEVGRILHPSDIAAGRLTLDEGNLHGGRGWEFRCLSLSLTYEYLVVSLN